MHKLIFLTLILWSISCVPPSEEDELDINIDLTLPAQQSIIEAQDKGDIIAIKGFLSSPNTTERFLATQACGSLQSPELKIDLIQILNSDLSSEIRSLAAYALGQLGETNVLPELVNSFGIQDSINYNSPVRGAILEAIGKIGDLPTLDLVSTASKYTSKDNHLLLGQARSIYRFGLRNIYSENGTKLMINRILDLTVPIETRLIAAHYLARNPSLNISDDLAKLTAHLINEEDIYIKMSLAGAIASKGDLTQAPILLSMLKSEPDYRVIVNLLRNLSSYEYSIYKDEVVELLDSENEHVFEIAASLLNNNVLRQDAGLFLEKAKSASSNDRKARLLGIALNALPPGYVNTRRNVCNEILAGLTISVSETDQAMFIKSLALDPYNLQNLIESGLRSSSNLVRTTAILSIKDLLTNPRTTGIYNRPYEISQFKSSIASEFSFLLNQADPGTVAAIATIVKDEQCGFKEIAGLNLHLRSAMRKMQVPKDYEAKSECIQALNYLEDTTYTLDLLDYNHPIDWTILEDISDSSRAYIITTRGQIEIQLYKNDAPGSVANFIDLAESNFYDSKNIHRVVPNFVIQGGCPRGDGYGSLEYSIRSELGPKYYNSEGHIGMASAGKDTEGTQWFITHAPAPHLDGRYTIFGKVISGMNVVHSIRQGDVIQDVRILKY